MKNIIIVVADSLRRDTMKEIVEFPVNLPLTRYTVTACNSCTEKSLPWMLSGMEVFSPTMSIPTDLKKLGYHTVLIHSNPVVDRFKGPFDQVIDLGNKTKVSRKLRRFNRVTRYVPNWLYKMFQGKDMKNYLPYARVTEKLEALSKVPWALQTPKPMFCWLHLMDPHTPYYPLLENPSEIVEINRNQISAVRGYYEPSKAEVRRWYELYKLESSAMFWRLLEWLDTVDYSKNTVILTSDHGEEFGEHGAYGHKGDRYWPENLEVPFLVIGEGVGTMSIQSHKTLRDLVRKLI